MEETLCEEITDLRDVLVAIFFDNEEIEKRYQSLKRQRNSERNTHIPLPESKKGKKEQMSQKTKKKIKRTKERAALSTGGKLPRHRLIRITTSKQ